MPVQARLGDEEARRTIGKVANPSRQDTKRVGPATCAGRGRDPRRCPVLAEELTQGVGPFACAATGVGEGDGGAHHVAARSDVAAQLVESACDRVVVSLRAPRADVVDQLVLDGRIDSQDAVRAVEG